MSALSECHLLSYLHACVVRGVVVTSYTDDAHGTMSQEGNGGRFTSVVLHPVVTVAEPGMVADAIAAHEDAHEWCFIASSVNFPVTVSPSITVAG